MTDKIKLVVQHKTLGYVIPQIPWTLFILKTRDYSYCCDPLCNSMPYYQEDARLAKKEDFDNFGVTFDGYAKDTIYEFDNK